MGFSFPLCGSGARVWTADLAANCLCTQGCGVFPPPRGLGCYRCIDALLGACTVFVSGQVDEAGIRHLIVCIVTVLSRDAEYVCIHEDSQPKSLALMMAHLHWHLTKAIKGVFGGQIGSRLDGDYSPSRPLAKAYRCNGPVASLFLVHP